MAKLINDSIPNHRAVARGFLASIREHADRAGTPGWVSVPELVRRVSEDASRKAKDWPTRQGRHLFLVELSSEANSEWMVQPGPDGLRAQFYAALRDHLREMAEAERA